MVDSHTLVEDGIFSCFLKSYFKAKLVIARRRKVTLRHREGPKGPVAIPLAPALTNLVIASEAKQSPSNEQSMAVKGRMRLLRPLSSPRNDEMGLYALVYEIASSALKRVHPRTDDGRRHVVEF